MIGPKTGNPADADPTHRQAVRLTRVTRRSTRSIRPTRRRPTGAEIDWCAEDALTFPLCLSAVMPAPDCACRDGISVARGNVLLVDSGATATETLGTVPTETSVAAVRDRLRPAGAW